MLSRSRTATMDVFDDRADTGGDEDMETDDGLDGVERRTYLDAADLALRAYPGALGELVRRELRAFAEFGYRLAGDGLIARLAVEVLSAVREGDTAGAGTPSGSRR